MYGSHGVGFSMQSGHGDRTVGSSIFRQMPCNNLIGRKRWESDYSEYLLKVKARIRNIGLNFLCFI